MLHVMNMMHGDVMMHVMHVMHVRTVMYMLWSPRKMVVRSDDRAHNKHAIDWAASLLLRCRTPTYVRVLLSLYRYLPPAWCA